MKLKSKLVMLVCILALGIGVSYMKVHSNDKSSKKNNPVNASQNNEKQNAIENKKTNENIINVNKKDVSEEKKDRVFKDGNLIHSDKGIPVLMYHSIAYEKNNELRMPKEQFKEQMQYLKDNGYTTLTLNELYSFF